MNTKRRKTRKKSGAIDRRGVALIMVLVITTVMGAIATDLANSAMVNVRAAANSRDQLQAYFHARSAVELELFLLRFQGQVKGALEQVGIPIPLFELSTFLVSSDTMKGILDRKERPVDQQKERSAALNQPFGNFDGSFWIEEVVDENRKININTPAGGCTNGFIHLMLAGLFNDPKYDPLFENIGDSRDPIRNRLEIISNITDWADIDDNVDPVCSITGDSSIGTAEDTRYDHLPYNVSYKPKNGQFTSLAELRMVPGVNDAFMRLFGPSLTVWSESKQGISMTTMEPRLMAGVIGAISPDASQPGAKEKFEKFFQEKALLMAFPPPLNKLTKDTFTQLLSTAGFNFDAAKLNSLIGQGLKFEDNSSVFRITAVGRVADTTSTLTVVWRDDRNLGEIFYWREE